MGLYSWSSTVGHLKVSLLFGRSAYTVNFFAVLSYVSTRHSATLFHAIPRLLWGNPTIHRQFV